MKLLKLCTVNHGQLWGIVDEIPSMTYEKVGANYVGSVVDENGDIIFSELLKYEGWPDAHAFGGRELELKMKDGSTEIIKNNWYDCGSYKPHGEFVNTGLKTLEGLQRCYVYCGYNINKVTWQKMIDKYLRFDKVYEYWDLGEWVNLQHEWYPVIVRGKEIPYMMNKKGDMVERLTKKRAHYRQNVHKMKINKTFYWFKFSYKDEQGKLIKIEANLMNVLRETLPLVDEEIRKNCRLN